MPLLFAAVLAVAQVPAWADSLTVLYLERPPYYFTHEGHPSGFLWALGDNVIREAGFDPVYESIPPQRILARMRDGDPVCSLGWFKRPDRETYAYFSEPLYRNRPLVVLHLWDDGGRFAGIGTVAELFARHDLIWGTVSSFTYGDHIEELRDKLKPKILEVSVPQGQLLGMLAMGRFDYMLISPEELEALAMMKQAVVGNLALPEPGTEEQRPGISAQRGEFAILQLADMPPGTPRRIMCAHSVGPDVIVRLNKAIAATLGRVE